MNQIWLDEIDLVLALLLITGGCFGIGWGERRLLSTIKRYRGNRRV